MKTFISLFVSSLQMHLLLVINQLFRDI